MCCPKCQSKRLDIRQETGLEPIMIFFTGKRKFRCRECEREFRAPDRRRTRRETSEAIRAAHPTALAR
jgi:Zn finger protein HypA/HybF involved in hydrogenase expression